MLKRNVAVVIVAGLVLGGAALAWAGGGPERPTVLAAAQSTESTDPSRPIQPRQEAPRTPEERQARREALRTCLQHAGENREARQACFAAAGVKPGHRPGPGVRKGGGHAGTLGLLGRAVHGSVVVPGEEGGWQTLTFDRGQVNGATDGDGIVLDRPDGHKVTLALTADTKYHGVENAAAIQEGRPATVVSRDGKALHVVQKDPARTRGPRTPENPGRPGNNEAPPIVPND